jgi:hypothetical protein
VSLLPPESVRSAANAARAGGTHGQIRRDALLWHTPRANFGRAGLTQEGLRT